MPVVMNGGLREMKMLGTSPNAARAMSSPCILMNGGVLPLFGQHAPLVFFLAPPADAHLLHQVACMLFHIRLGDRDLRREFATLGGPEQDTLVGR